MNESTAHSDARGSQFARQVLDAFDAAGNYTDDLVRAADGPSSTWMTGLRKAAHGEAPLRAVRGDTFKAIERAAKWPPGTARRVWLGEIAPPEPSPNVGGGTQTQSSPAWNTRRPEGITDEEHRRIVQEAEDYYRWKIEQALRNR